MAHTTQIAALKMVVLALDEVQRFGGKLPSYDEPEDGDEAEVPPATFLDLVKQYADKRTPESELISAIDAIAPLLPSYDFSWK